MPKTALPKDTPINEAELPASKNPTTVEPLTNQQIAELSGFAWSDPDPVPGMTDTDREMARAFGFM